MHICASLHEPIANPAPETLEGSVEEEEQNDIIVSLQEGHVCEDRACANYGKYCVAIGPDGRHVTLTPLHFRVWSAAVVWFLCSIYYTVLILWILCINSAGTCRWCQRGDTTSFTPLRAKIRKQR